MAEARRKDQLNTRRMTLIASLGRAEKFNDDYDAERDALEVQLRLENLDVVWQSLDEAQTALEELETTTEGKSLNLQFRAGFEPRLFKIKANLKAKLPPPIIPQTNRPLETPSRALSTLSGLKLPTISLPEFDGDYKQWLTFHDTFLALIHENPELPSIQKFHYLRAAVKGEAAQLIETIAISAANYPLAWQTLNSRYSNEYLLKKRHLQDLLDIPRMKRETAAALHSTVDDFQRHIKILQQLGEPTRSWSTLLEHLLCIRLHDDTIRAWEDHAATVDDQSYTCLVEFLEKRIRVLESISVNHGSALPVPAQASTPPFYRRSPIPARMSTHSATESYSPKCHACDQRHLLVQCPTFEKMSLSDKMRVVNSKRLCHNCFRQDHFARECRSNYTCRVCNNLHHSLIHPGTADLSGNYNVARSFNQSSSRPSTSFQSNSSPPNNHGRNHVQTNSVTALPDSLQWNSTLRAKQSTVFMLTVVLRIIDVYGKEHYARALLDSASQPNLMSDRLAQLLRLRRQKANILVHGIGEKPEHASQSVTTEIRSRKGNFTRDVTFLVLKRMTSSLPDTDVPVNDWNLPEDIFLADPGFNRSSGIDMIIGTHHFFECFPSAARIQLSSSLPILVDSVFGWVVAGGAHLVPSSKDSVCCKTVSVSMATLEENLERFWKIEELPARSDLSVEEKMCEDNYRTTISRNEEGRYVVRLPKQQNFDTMIGESRSTALRRFNLLERRFEKDPGIKAEYDKFMGEYISLCHMRPIEDNSDSVSNTFYLSHHPVIKESSTTTKTRVVFDGSSKSSSGFTLNEALCVGPVVQDDLLTLVLRFRTYPVALVADIAKMYRQILVHPDDTRLQRIWWRFLPTEPMRIYELQTVTYGLTPSSFLATRTLQQLADDDGHSYPLGGPALKKSFYIDDFIGGAESVEEATQLRNELTELLARGGFPLRKFISNSLEVLQGLAKDQVGTQSSLKFDPDESVKALGITWEPEPDQFRFEFQVNPAVHKPTKRSILSTISQLFDPLGIIAPVIVRGKMIIQDLWLTSCSWDDEVPETLKHKWLKLHEQLPLLSDYRVDRYAFQPNSRVQLHTFADASESAYGACTYARAVDTEGNVRVQLLAAKSRVAPLKRLSLPRLELCATVVAAQLHARVVEALGIEIMDSFFWSDSTVTLQWLLSPPSAWKTFVANRVSEIQTTTHGSHWHHIAGTQNPADLVSRGMQVHDFLKSKLWKNGPEWLCLPESSWPITNIIDTTEAENERKNVVVAIATLKPIYNQIFLRYSQLTRLVRIVAQCQKFIQNLQSKARTQPVPFAGPNPSKLPTVEQLAQAKILLVRLAQADCFQEELRNLSQEKPLSKKSPMRLLNPFIDHEGILRVGGRLKLGELPYLSKHPALLPSFHPYTTLLAKSFHFKLVHGGGSLTLAAMREEYWPMKGGRLVRSIIRNCFQCARANPVPVSQQIGQLPASRITVGRPFSVTGVDYAGPLYLKPIHKRAEPTKAYICLFICFVTKAVHIELVSDMTTPAFLAALRRFVARRGCPAHLHSDNGLNFIGANNELHQLYRMLANQEKVDTIQKACADEKITWHFNPPKAPHFGGLWESAIKVAKKQLYRQLGKSRLSYEDMSTVLAEIEAAMNSRPLVPMTEDPNDFAVLTPAHFLISTTMHAVPSPDVCAIPINRLDHYQRMQELYQQFWHHWRTEYLQQLQKDTRSCHPNTNIQVGQLVLIVDEFQHPVRWPLARIVAVHPGKDNLIRVVTLCTPKGPPLKRPITKICILPMESTDPVDHLDPLNQQHQMEHPEEQPQEQNQMAQSTKHPEQPAPQQLRRSSRRRMN